MLRKLNVSGLALLLVALVAAVGCGPSEEEMAAREAAQREAQWAELQEQKAELEALRDELTEVEATLEEEAAEAVDEPSEDDGEMGEGEEPVEDPAARAEALQAEIDQLSEQYYTALVDFINAKPMLEGEEPSELQKAAIRAKSEEDMLVAEEYIMEGGDYRRAIGIYQDALRVDPDNAEIQAALERAEANRYMSEERFDQLEDGMTQEEVRDLLGTPYYANVREFPEDGVVAWFYPVDPKGSAAAVWFRQRGDDMEVYKFNFEEVVKEGPTEVTAGGDDGS